MMLETARVWWWLGVGSLWCYTALMLTMTVCLKVELRLQRFQRNWNNRREKLFGEHTYLKSFKFTGVHPNYEIWTYISQHSDSLQRKYNFFISNLDTLSLNHEHNISKPLTLKYTEPSGTSQVWQCTASPFDNGANLHSDTFLRYNIHTKYVLRGAWKDNCTTCRTTPTNQG